MLATSALALCAILTACGGGSPANLLSHDDQSQTASVSAGSHILGDANAKVTIIKFCDFQCPYCKSFHTDTEWQVFNEYVATGKARIAFRHFPLTIHQNAAIAAEAAECAAKVGGNDAFWKYHDTLFTKGQSNGTGLDLASLKQYAADLGFETATFNNCLDTHETAAMVDKDSGEGRSEGVYATPTLFINGKEFVGAMSFGTIKAAVDSALQ